MHVKKKLSKMTAAERARLPPEVRDSLYQQEYYERNRQSRNDTRKHRWRSDLDFRNRLLEQMKEKRAFARQETVDDRLIEAIRAKEAIDEQREEESSRRATRRPRLVEINGVKKFVYSTGALAHSLGRESQTLRAWLSAGVLPGCSVVIGNKAWFTQGFGQAVFQALRRTMLLDARAPRDMLRGLVREELEIAHEPWVPAPQRKGGSG